MMLERSRVTVVAEILFSRRLSSEEQEERIHCRCSRAFVQDRALYRSDNRLLPFDPADTRVQEADDEEEEEEEEKEEVLDEEAQLMASMGLPVTFLCSSDRRRAGRRSNRKPAPYQAESAEEEEDDVQVDHTDGVKEACDPPEEATGGTDAAGWETYWAQQGQALLWSSWLEKHPETDPGSVTALWDDPDTNAVWDKHAAETYYSYWEQYSYWSAQGWTTGGEEAAAAAAGGGVGGDKEAHPEDQRDGQPGAESQQRDQEGGGDLNDLLGQKCTLEAGGRCVSDSEAGRQRVGVAEPSDGGGDGKRPAASSPQNNAEHTDSQQAAGSPDRRDGSRGQRPSRDNDDDDDTPPGGGRAKVKRSHELDVEESPNLTPEEAWSKLGLKHNPDPLFHSVLSFKGGAGETRPKQRWKKRAVHKHTRFSGSCGDDAQTSTSLSKVPPVKRRRVDSVCETRWKEEWAPGWCRLINLQLHQRFGT